MLGSCISSCATTVAWWKKQGIYAALGWAVSPLLPDFLSHAGFLWPLEQGRALRTEAFTLSPVPVPSQCIFSLLPAPHPCRMVKPFPHQSKEWPQEGVKGYIPVAVGQLGLRPVVLAACDWAISLGKKLS